MSWPWLRPTLVVLALCALPTPPACLGAQAEANDAEPAKIGETPDGRPLHPWNPSQSWPGGPQFDPRLDQPVNFWGAGISLSDVFASVKEQTGVEIGFVPAGDENERICVNLYLNREDPPSLREVMAQLSWVLDCPFAYCHVDENRLEYRLLSTSARFGAVARLSSELRAYAERVWRQRDEREEQTAAAMAGKVAELSDALALSREEAIRRYLGSDDLLLLALVEPGKRRMAEFVLDLPEEDLGRLLEEGELLFPWGDLTPQQKGALRQHFAGPDVEAALEQGRLRGDAADWNPSGELPFNIRLTGIRNGFVLICGELDGGDAGEDPWEMHNPLGDHLRLLRRGQSPEDTLELLWALGETPETERIRAIYDEAATTDEAERQGRLQDQRREWLQSRLDSRNVRSPEIERVLTEFRFPGSPSGSYPLWAVQEAIAAGTGLHLVSDCFSQPNRSVTRFLELMPDEATTDLTGLLALKLWSLFAAEGEEFPRLAIDHAPAGWEWGDAGDFLRFRSLARDLWRYSLLPEGTLSRLDACLAPYVSQAAESGAAAGAVTVDLAYSDACWLAGALTDAQLHYGGKIIYADPSETPSAYAHAFRQAVLRAVATHGGPFRFLASLNDYQWQRLRGPGLRWQEDLSPEQRSIRLGSYLAPILEEATQDVVLLLGTQSTTDRSPTPTPGVSRADELIVQMTAARPQHAPGPGPRFRRAHGPPIGPPSGAEAPPQTISHAIPLPRQLIVHLSDPEAARQALLIEQNPAP